MLCFQHFSATVPIALVCMLALDDEAPHPMDARCRGVIQIACSIWNVLEQSDDEEDSEDEDSM